MLLEAGSKGKVEPLTDSAEDTNLQEILAAATASLAGIAYVTVGEKISARPGFEPRASGILSLHSTTELPNQISISLMIYHQMPVPDYIAIHFAKCSEKYWIKKGKNGFRKAKYNNTHF